MTFVTGQQVRCESSVFAGNELTRGKIYTIHHISGTNIFIDNDHGERSGYSQGRFNPAKITNWRRLLE